MRCLIRVQAGFKQQQEQRPSRYERETDLAFMPMTGMELHFSPQSPEDAGRRYCVTVTGVKWLERQNLGQKSDDVLVVECRERYSAVASDLERTEAEVLDFDQWLNRRGFHRVKA